MNIRARVFGRIPLTLHALSDQKKDKAYERKSKPNVSKDKRTRKIRKLKKMDKIKEYEMKRQK